MTDFDYYLIEDHAARQKTTLICVVAGAVVGLLLRWFDSPLNVTAIACVVTAGTVETARALTYRQPSRKRLKAFPVFQVRRSLLRTAFSAVSILILALLRVPQIGAAIVERKLKQATAGNPPYNDADKLISTAIQNDIPISPDSIHAAKRQVTRAYSNLTPDLRQSVLVTLSQLEAYQVYVLTGAKLNVGPVVVFSPAGIYTFHAPVFVPPGPILVGEERSRTIINVDFEYTHQMPAAFVFGPRQFNDDALIGHLTASRGRDDIFIAPAFAAAENVPYKVAIIDVTVSKLSQTLDEIIWADVTFDQCHITYRGGRLRMKAVIFKECDFTGDSEAARAVLDKIRLQGQKPITIGLS